ncbi:O-antigen ligase family protein [Trichothermofontia sp.]
MFSRLPSPHSTSRGRLLGLLVAGFYALFTLLPDSSTLVLKWPWVFLWQVALLCPVLWWLWLLWPTDTQEGPREGAKQGATEGATGDAPEGITGKDQDGSALREIRRKRVQGLGHGLDWVAGVAIGVLLISTAQAEFAAIARWHAWAGLGFLAALYAIAQWLQTPQQRMTLLIGQGYLNLTFIVLSLFLWASQTWQPELARLATLRSYGVDLPYDFSQITLRNWAPIGHQNYVAGYLLLALPLLGGLAWLQTGWRRGIWVAGVALGLLDLYTTQSRAGWLGLVVILGVGLGVLAWSRRRSRRWLGGILAAGGGIVLVFVVTSTRLQTTLAAIARGDVGEELGYRLITTVIGWRIGLAHPWTGAGPGSVLPLFQRYRPFWAGREAELMFQLHNTPAHLWAELGIWGLGLPLVAIGLLLRALWQWRRRHGRSVSRRDKIFVVSLGLGLLGYSVNSLLDYQLDIIGIAGTLVIYLACLAAISRDTPTASPGVHLAFPPLPRLPAGLTATGERHSTFGWWPSLHQRLPQPPWLQFSWGDAARSLLQGGRWLRAIMLVISGGTFAVVIWLIPIHRAWHTSSQAFLLLNPIAQAADTQERRNLITTFTELLTQSMNLAPWEAYYPYQLGWNLGNFSLKTNDRAEQQALIRQGIAALQTATQVSPYQEFGYTTLGWLWLTQAADKAEPVFRRSVQLLLAKRGGWYALGIAWLVQGRREAAIAAFTLEILRDPVWLTSPVWQTEPLVTIYPDLLNSLERSYTELLQTPGRSARLTTYLHQCRGALRWWRGDLAAAQTDWQTHGNWVSQQVLALALRDEAQVRAQLPTLPVTAASQAIAAWLTPDQRPDLLLQAWIRGTHALPDPTLIKDALTSMNAAPNFDTWLKQAAPVRESRRTRTGFGILNRHIDGPAPIDFLVVKENRAIVDIFPELFPSISYFPEFDRLLQPQREQLLP